MDTQLWLLKTSRDLLRWIRDLSIVKICKRLRHGFNGQMYMYASLKHTVNHLTSISSMVWTVLRGVNKYGGNHDSVLSVSPYDDS